jgi:hypothetical protein
VAIVGDVLHSRVARSNVLLLTTLAMMSKKWCEDNKAERPVDRRKGIENTASFKANGTGPFRIINNYIEAAGENVMFGGSWPATTGLIPSDIEISGNHILKNTAWRNPQFRGYADHMETEVFRKGVEELLELAGDARVAVMCAEAVWWRCHRSLIADYLKAAGHKVIHILDEKKTEEHPFTSAARIVDGQLSYRGLL